MKRVEKTKSSKKKKVSKETHNGTFSVHPYTREKK